MESKAIQLMKSHFDALSHTSPEEGVGFWFARDLLEPLGYARCENSHAAIKPAAESCLATGYVAENHLRSVTKMIEIGKGRQRREPRSASEKFPANPCTCRRIGMLNTIAE